MGRGGGAVSAPAARRPAAGPGAGSGVLVGLVAFTALLLFTPVLAAHAAYVVSGRPWPTTGGPLWSMIHLWSSPGTPLRAWPNENGRPPTWLVWALTAAMLGALTVAVAFVVVLLLRRSRRSGSGGMASAGQEARTVTLPALRSQAEHLRPRLAASTAARDIRPEQLGTFIGRSSATRQPIYLPAETSGIVSGLSGSGKTTSVAIPAVLDWDGPQVISTTKTDLLRTTWRAAADRGPVAVFDLMDLAGGVLPALSWSPIAECDDPETADTRSRVLLDRGTAGHDPNSDFRAEGRRVVRALLHAAALSDATVSEMLAWAYNPQEQKPEQIIANSTRGWRLYAEELRAVRLSPERQRAGAYLSVRSAMDGLSSPRVLGGIDGRPSRSTSMRQWLTDGTGSLYLISHKVDLPGAEKVVTLLVADILSTARQIASASPGGRLDPLLGLWADEGTNAAQLSNWATVLSDSRGWGISAKLLVQSRALLRGTYGREAGEAIWGAAGMRLLVGGGEGGTDTRELAEAFGEHEVSTMSRSTGGNSTVGTRRQAVRTAADIRNLDPGQAILLASQLPPIEVSLTPWWQRKDAAATTAAVKQFDQARADHHRLPTAPIAVEAL